MLFTQNPEGVAWVMGTVVTQPAILPAALNFCQIGIFTSPFGPMFKAPLFTRFPPPHEELAAAESVIIESAEAISIKPRLTLLSLYRFSQLEPTPFFCLRKISAIFKVPVLIPSLTIMIIFFTFPLAPGKINLSLAE